MILRLQIFADFGEKVRYVTSFVVKLLSEKRRKNMARRGENIFKRKDGRWEARVIECRSDGKRVYRSLYGKTYTEAKAKKKSITA